MTLISKETETPQGDDMVSQGLGRDQCGSRDDAGLGATAALTKGAPINVDQSYDIVFPFLVTTFSPLPESDGEGGVSFPEERETWRPGWAPYANQYTEGSYCHGWGREFRKVVSIHKPGRYPERVFYTRLWLDPDGRAFGKGSLRMTTTAAFKSWASGARYDGVFPEIELWPRPTAEQTRGAA